MSVYESVGNKKDRAISDWSGHYPRRLRKERSQLH